VATRTQSSALQNRSLATAPARWVGAHSVGTMVCRSCCADTSSVALLAMVNAATRTGL